NSRVFPDENIIKKAVSQAPKKFKLKARNPQNTVSINKNSSILGPPLGSPFIIESENQRYTNFNDYKKLIKLIQSSEYLDLNGGDLVPVTDLENKIKYKKKFSASIKYSDKCLIGTGSGETETQKCLKMGEKIFGKNNFKNNNYLLYMAGISSPLQFESDALNTIMNSACYNQPVSIYSQILAGISGPSTLAGLLVQQNAEILTGLTLVQMISPGTPVIYGSFSSTTNMKTGEICTGNPLNSKIIGSTAQISNYYNLPSMTGGALTDHEKLTHQNVTESAFNLFTSLGYGIDIILFSAGALKDYLGISYKKFLSDIEMLKRIDTYNNNLKINQDTIAREVIQDIEPGGNFLTHSHTLNHLKNNNTIKDNNSAVNNKERFKNILENYEKPDLPEKIDHQLSEFLQNSLPVG
ncbi:MAG: trimethylamine methyltransferase family protein, partial [Bacillota bacterium]